MTTGGWITFLSVTLSVTLFFFYSMHKVLKAKKPKKIHPIYEEEKKL